MTGRGFLFIKVCTCVFAIVFRFYGQKMTAHK